MALVHISPGDSPTHVGPQGYYRPRRHGGPHAEVKDATVKAPVDRQIMRQKRKVVIRVASEIQDFRGDIKIVPQSGSFSGDICQLVHL